MLDIARVSRRLEHREMPFEIAVLIGEGVFEAIANARLRGEMDDPADAVRFDQFADQPGARDVAVDQPEVEIVDEPRDARLLERDVVIVGEIVEPEHAFAAREEPFGHSMADKARGAGYQDGAVVGHAACLSFAASASSAGWPGRPIPT